MPRFTAEERILTRQIERWVNDEMIPTTPIEEWGEALADLLVTWANDYGVIFTDESLDAVQRWIAHEQELALEERELAAGRKFHHALHEAARAGAESERLLAAPDGTIHFTQDLETGEFAFSVVPSRLGADLGAESGAAVGTALQKSQIDAVTPSVGARVPANVDVPYRYLAQRTSGRKRPVQPYKSSKHGEFTHKGDFKLHKPIPDRTGNLAEMVPHADKSTVPFKYPEFDDWALGEVEIYVTGDSRFDRTQAILTYKQKYGEMPKGELIYHHDAGQTRKSYKKRLFKSKVQLVPEDLNLRVPHRGSRKLAEDFYKELGIDIKNKEHLAKLKAIVRKENARLRAAITPVPGKSVIRRWPPKRRTGGANIISPKARGLIVSGTALLGALGAARMARGAIEAVEQPLEKAVQAIVDGRITEARKWVIGGSARELNLNRGATTSVYLALKQWAAENQNFGAFVVLEGLPEAWERYEKSLREALEQRKKAEQAEKAAVARKERQEQMEEAKRRLPGLHNQRRRLTAEIDKLQETIQAREREIQLCRELIAESQRNQDALHAEYRRQQEAIGTVAGKLKEIRDFHYDRPIGIRNRPDVFVPHIVRTLKRIQHMSGISEPLRRKIADVAKTLENLDIPEPLLINEEERLRHALDEAESVAVPRKLTCELVEFALHERDRWAKETGRELRAVQSQHQLTVRGLTGRVRKLENANGALRRDLGRRKADLAELDLELEKLPARVEGT